MLKNKKSYKYYLFLLLILLLPFSLINNKDKINAQLINDSSIGYYQSTTCKISLLEVISKNITNNYKLYINNNDYAGIECFGKVTGLDKVEDTFFLSIGTNTTLALIIQSTFWLFLLFIFTKKRDKKVELSYIPVFTTSLLFSIQQISENRFYAESNKYYNESFEITNYYLFSHLLIFLLTSLVLKDLFENRKFSILYFLPFMYLFPGTFLGMNLNIYLIIFSFFGFQSIFLNKTNKNFNYIYISFTLIWMLNKKETINFFDTDKLRGFVNSSNNLTSTIFWIIVFYLLLNGIIFLLTYESTEKSLSRIKDSFLLSGSLITAFGILGSTAPIFNFFNFYIFGQNKRGMKDLESVAGNTWRGFSSSAEFIGEFYAICLLVLIYYYLSNNNKLLVRDFILGSICLFGLYKSNNFAAIVSLFAFSIFFIMKFKYNHYLTKKILILCFVVILIAFGSVLKLLDYENSSSILVEEAILHSNLFQYSDNYLNSLSKEKFFEENDYKTLMIRENNYTRASSSLLLLINTMIPNFNIPLVPNLVALVSAISLIVNRTELWGIFIAKYSPTLADAVFGYGPFQLSNYLYDHRIRLDVPEYKLNMLYLPHSSYLDSILFYGIAGVSIFLIYCGVKFYKKEYLNGLFLYLFVYLLINLLKSDSLLYIPTFTIFVSVFYKTFLEKNFINKNV